MADTVQDTFDSTTPGEMLRRQFRSVKAVAAQLSGEDILALVGDRDIRAVTLDAPVKLAAP